MELLQIEYVLALAKYQSFTKASENLNVSQSSISQQIIKLENELGVKLFNRTTRAVYPTAIGIEFIKQAEIIMQEKCATELMIKQYCNLERGALTISGFTNIGAYDDILEMVSSFRKKYPALEIIFQEDEIYSMKEKLYQNEIDIAIFNVLDPTLYSEKLFTDEIVLLVPKGHNLAEREYINLIEAKNERFLFTRKRHPTHVPFLNACRESGFEPEALYNFTTIQTVVSLVEQGYGVTLFSYHMVRNHINDNIRMVRIIPPKTRTIYLVTVCKDRETPSVKKFKEYAKEVFHK